MAWLVAATIVVLLFFLAGFRKFALGLLASALIGGFVLYQHIQQKQERERTRIPASQVILENLALRATYGSSYELSGRLRNNSAAYRLDGISFNVTIRDCEVKDKSACTTIGEATAHVAITVPPQQAREFTGSLYFGSSEMKVKGTLAWDYEIAAITAKRQ